MYWINKVDNKQDKDGNIIIAIIMQMLLKVYVGMIGLSAVRELITIFIV